MPEREVLEITDEALVLRVPPSAAFLQALQLFAPFVFLTFVYLFAQVVTETDIDDLDGVLDLARAVAPTLGIWALVLVPLLAWLTVRMREPWRFDRTTGEIWFGRRRVGTVEELEALALIPSMLSRRRATLQLRWRVGFWRRCVMPGGVDAIPSEQLTPAAQRIAELFDVTLLEVHPVEHLGYDPDENHRVLRHLPWVVVIMLAAAAVGMTRAAVGGSGEFLAWLAAGTAFAAYGSLRMALHRLRPVEQRPAWAVEAASLYVVAALLLAYAVYGFVDALLDLARIIDDPGIATIAASVDLIFPTVALTAGLLIGRLARQRHRAAGLLGRTPRVDDKESIEFAPSTD